MMQRTMTAARIVRRIAATLALVAGCMLIAYFIFPQVTAAFGRIADVALRDSNDLLGLTLICAAAGLLVIINRSRRAKIRQASA